MPTPEPVALWRVFPLDRAAAPGARYSPRQVPPPTGRGRFDLPRDLSPVLYLADTPEHAVAETLQPWRGRCLEPWHLERAGLPLALVEVTLAPDVAAGLSDLCDPATLMALGTTPDVTASRRREQTQPIARSAWDRGTPGLRWWSSFWGDWHTVVLFTARIPDGLGFGEPEVLEATSASVLRAAQLLGMPA